MYSFWESPRKNGKGWSMLHSNYSRRPDFDATILLPYTCTMCWALIFFDIPTPDIPFIWIQHIFMRSVEGMSEKKWFFLKLPTNLKLITHDSTIEQFVLRNMAHFGSIESRIPPHNWMSLCKLLLLLTGVYIFWHGCVATDILSHIGVPETHLNSLVQRPTC